MFCRDERIVLDRDLRRPMRTSHWEDSGKGYQVDGIDTILELKRPEFWFQPLDHFHKAPANLLSVSFKIGGFESKLRREIQLWFQSQTLVSDSEL
jgi:hypothetical protein